MRIMNRFYSIIIALAILCSLCLFGPVKSSHGFEVTSMSVDNGASGCYVSLTVDGKDIDWIHWYIDNVHVYTSTHSDGTRSVYENIGYLPGSPFGKTYTIEALVFHHITDLIPLRKVPIFVCQSDPYDVTVYSQPVKNIKYASHTMSKLSASIDVGWNGRTAEVTASASITSHGDPEIIYGFNMRYSIVRLTPNGQWIANVWNQPGGLIEVGTLKEKEGPPYSADYSKSDSYDGRLLGGGFKYLLQGQITATAQPIGGGAQAIDELPVSDTEELFISLDE